MSGTRARARRRVCLVVAVGLLALAVPASAQDSEPISGGGSSFAQLEIEQWRADVAKPPLSLKVDYSAAGSTFGRNKFASSEFDYGATDIEYQAAEPKPSKPFVYVPVSAGGLGFMYNLKGTDGRRITNLRLSQVNVCRVFTETFIHWDDPAIKADNPGVLLPHNLVKRVVRSDGSGTSYVLSEFCIATAPAIWNQFRADLAGDQNTSQEFKNGLPTSDWPKSYASSSNAFAADGVANVVANDQSGQNAITYAEAGFAEARGYPNAIVRNAAGIYTEPKAENVTVALGYAKGRANGTFELQYLIPDPKAYFPSTYSYALAYTEGSAGKGATLATFLNYAVCEGQSRAVPLGYARLSTVLVELAINKITQIPGAPPPPALASCGAPPPPKIDPNFKPVPPPTVPRAVAPGTGGTRRAGPAGAGAANGSTGGASTDTGAAVDPATGVALDAAVVEGEVEATKELEQEVADANTAAATADGGVSAGEGLWFLLLGFALVGLGTMTGGGEMLRRRRGGS
jgi:phosphate transport system substrate-binding protein